MNKKRISFISLVLSTFIFCNNVTFVAATTVENKENEEKVITSTLTTGEDEQITDESNIEENITEEDSIKENTNKDEQITDESDIDENITEEDSSKQNVNEDELEEEKNEDENKISPTALFTTISYDKEETYKFSSSGSDEVKYQFYVSKPGRVVIKFSFDRGNGNTKTIKLTDGKSGNEIKKLSSSGSYTASWVFYLESGYYNFSIATSKEAITSKVMVSYADCQVTEKEPNNIKENATSIELNGQATGIFSVNDEVDWYKFTVKEAGWIPFDFITHFQESVYFYLYSGSSYDYFYKWDEYQQANFLEPKKCRENLYLLPGTYYLKVQSKSNAGKYIIQLPFKSAETNEKEPNNYSYQAQNINFNSEVRGMLGHNDSIDWYKITVTNDTKIELKAKLYQNTSLRSYLYKDPSENYINSFLFNGTNSSWYDPRTSTKELTLSKGTYYLKVVQDPSVFPYISHYYGKYRLEVNTKSFDDTSGHWAENEIEEFARKGYINTSKAYFNPDSSITRAEFIKLVNKTFGFTRRGKVSFKDVKSNNWFYNEVAIAVEAGYISTKNAEFRPNDPITREEVASIITTIKKNKDSNLDKIKKYKDYYKISSWARTSVEGAVEAGYMGVNSTYFNPKNNITRAQAVVTLSRIN